MKTKKTCSQTTGLASEYQRILQEQSIDVTGPGTILRDFESLLQCVQDSSSFKVTGKYNLVPVNMLADINALFAHPIRVDLRRPQQKSYPNILALYWLLRANGFIFIEGAGTKQHAQVDEMTRQTWSRLNPTEQYCGLLETWLLRAKPEIIGERSGGFIESPLSLWKALFEYISAKGMNIARNKEVEQMLAYLPGYRNLALLHMFGCITLQDDVPCASS